MTEVGRMIYEEGKAENQIEIATNLLKVLSDELIAQTTGLELSKVKELRKAQTESDV